MLIRESCVDPKLFGMARRPRFRPLGVAYNPGLSFLPDGLRAHADQTFGTGNLGFPLRPESTGAVT